MEGGGRGRAEAERTGARPGAGFLAAKLSVSSAGCSARTAAAGKNFEQFVPVRKVDSKTAHRIGIPVDVLWLVEVEESEGRRVEWARGAKEGRAGWVPRLGRGKDTYLPCSVRGYPTAPACHLRIQLRARG